MLPIGNLRRRSKATIIKVGPRSPLRLLTLLAFTLLVGIIVVLAKVFPLPLPNTRLNYILGHSPSWVAGGAGLIWPSHKPWGTIEDIVELRRAPWPGSFGVPELGTATGEEVLTWNGTGFDRTRSPEIGPAFLMLHIFSMPNEASRTRRALIRKYHPINSVPLEYQHLVEIKFVLGFNEIKEDTSSEARKRFEKEEMGMELEEREFGDLIRLKGLKGGENMNQGKTLGWMRWVGREGGRESQWVMKCDDDTIPVLPNLLPLLTDLDPSQPTYIGTALGHFCGYAYYFEGMMYGFNWGVIKTMASANLDDWILHRNFDEDAYTGMLMYNLPSKPDHPLAKSPTKNPHPLDPTNGTPYIPQSPDPRTGLMRIDLGNRAGSFDRWWIAGPKRAVAWHYLKIDASYASAHEYAVRGLRRMGREYMWRPPRSFRHLASGEREKSKGKSRWGLSR